MSEMNIAKGVENNSNGWNVVMQKMLQVVSYKKFFEVTSKHNPIVVKNDYDLYEFNKKGNCHLNCKKAEEDGLGIRVSGWYVMNEFTHEAFANGMCRLIYHSNLLLADGTMVNITKGGSETSHIFIQDNGRDFDFENMIGYNDRMLFGDKYMVGCSVPRNKVHFAARSEFSRDLMFEKFKIYKPSERSQFTIPTNFSYEKQIQWLTLKTNCHLG